MERNFEKEYNAVNNAYKALGEAQYSLDHVFAVFDMPVRSFYDVNNEIEKTKLRLSNMKKNSKKIEKCCDVFNEHNINFDEKYNISEHLKIIFEMNKASVYAAFEFYDKEKYYSWRARDYIGPAVRDCVNAYCKSHEMEIDLNNIQNADEKTIACFLSAISNDEQLSKMCENIADALVK